MKWVSTTDEKHHFYVSSAATWMVGYDPDELITKMKREKLCFNLWLVPGPKTAAYRISMFAPQVEGAVFLALYQIDIRQHMAGR